MKMKFAVWLAVAAFHMPTAFAKSPSDTPLSGHWGVDVAHLPMPPEKRPKSVTIDFAMKADGQWWTHVEIVDENDHKMYTESTLPLDGKPGKAVGNYWVDVVSAKMPAPNVLILQLAYKGEGVSTRIYSVADDRNALTETEAFFQKDGTPVLRTAVFHRLP